MFKFNPVEGSLDLVNKEYPFSLTKEPTGFTAPESVVVSYDSTTRKVTLTGTVEAYWQGTKISVLTSGWVSEAHTATTGAWFLFYNGSAFVWQQTPWTFDMLQIAYVNYGTSNKFALRETHGLMEWQTHNELHNTVGTYLSSGADFSSYVLASTTAGDRRPIVSATTIKDEDLETVNPSLTSDLYTQLTLTSTGTSVFTLDQAEIVPVSGTQPYFNEFSGGTWNQTLMSTSNYMSIWLVAFPSASDATSQKYRYLWMQGQSQSSSISAQQSLTPSNLNLGQLTSISPEFVFIGKVIIRYLAGDWTIEQVDKITTTKATQSIAQAGGISFVSTDETLTGDGTPVSPLSVFGKQDTLVSGTNIKTINGSTVLGAGNLVVSGALPEMVITKLVSTTNATVPTGYAASFEEYYEIGSGFTTEIEAGAILAIK